MSRIFSINKRRNLLGVGFGTTVIDEYESWKPPKLEVDLEMNILNVFVRANLLFKWDQDKPKLTTSNLHFNHLCAW